jgi:RimJ/RimL family protein N-acetyltransferase
MSAPPKTVLHATPEEEAAIRAAVRGANVKLLGEDCAIATLEHVAALTDLLSDPAVSDPIYDLPHPIMIETIADWVRDAEEKRRSGEAILSVRVDADGRVYAYSRFTVWPERSAAEIAGAYRADMQSKGGGKAGAARSFDWMFEHLGVRLICVTAALDNVRSARVIEAAGFAPMGERESARTDGTSRRSLYWEMSREAWAGRRAGEGAVS